MSFRCLAPVLWMALVLLNGCATVSTRVTLFEPAQTFAPTDSVVILLSRPERPHVNLALIEARGAVGGMEAELWADTRKRAEAIGADAVVKVELRSQYHPPAQIYDPWMYYPFHPRYRDPFRIRPPYPYSVGPLLSPGDHTPWIPGGYALTLKVMAIKYSQATE